MIALKQMIRQKPYRCMISKFYYFNGLYHKVQVKKHEIKFDYFMQEITCNSKIVIRRSVSVIPFWFGTAYLTHTEYSSFWLTPLSKKTFESALIDSGFKIIDWKDRKHKNPNDFLVPPEDD